MIEYSDTIAPRARSSGLVVRELEDEVLIFDVERETAFCLNGTAGMVWKCCDGQTSVEEIRLQLQRELSTPVGIELVWKALANLNGDGLLDEAVSLPEPTSKMSRRDLMKRAGITVAVPVIASLAVPAVALATGSCISGCGSATTCQNDAGCGACSTVGTNLNPGATASGICSNGSNKHCYLPSGACTACAANCQTGLSKSNTGGCSGTQGYYCT